jgi:hypothetical protein
MLAEKLREHFGPASAEEKKNATSFIDLKDCRICIVRGSGDTIRFWE